MNCNLAIYDNEIDYANHLMEYIKRKQKILGQVRIFTNTESLKEFLMQGQIHILLLGEDIKLSEVLHDNIKNICLLSEGSHMPLKESYPVIYKYQSGEVIANELLSYFPAIVKTTSREGINENTVKVISIYSLGEEIDRQKFALSMALGFSEVKKTLYINLNFYQVFLELLKGREEKSLSDVIYFLKQEHPNLNSKLKESVKKFYNLDYVPGVAFAPELLDIGIEDIKLLLKQAEEGEYEVVVFDIACISQAMLELFQNSQELYLIAGEGLSEEVMYEEFKKQMEWAGFGEVFNKFKLVLLNAEEKSSFKESSTQGFDIEKVTELTSRYVNLSF